MKKSTSFTAAYKLGVDFVAAMLVGMIIGYWIDVWLETDPVFLIIFILIGAAAGFLSIYRTTKAMMNDQDKDPSDA